jgi:hypothetical protein
MFAPILKLIILYLLLAICLSHNWKVCHLNVVMAFLNPKIDNDNIYMELPDSMDWVNKCTLKGAKVHLLKLLSSLK